MVRDCILCSRLTFKRYCKRKGFFISIIVFPVLIFLLGMLTEQGDREWRVALYTEEAGVAEDICQRLVEQSDFIRFYECDTIESMKQDVVSKKAECGVVFHDGFEKAVETFYFNEQVTLYYAPSSMAQRMIREEVFAATLAQVNETLLLNFMEQQGYEDDFQRERFIESYRRSVEKGEVFHFLFEEIPTTKKGNGEYGIFTSPVRGMLAVFIWAEILLAALLLYDDEKNGIYRVMSARRKWLCQFHILGIPAAIVSALSLTVLYCGHIFYKIPILSIWEEAGWLIGYSLLCVLSTIGIYYCCKQPALYVLTVTILLMAGVVLCPVFYSLHVIIPRLSFVQYMLIPGAYIAQFHTGHSEFFGLQAVVIIAWILVIKVFKGKGFFQNR